ncbi:MAG: hypothetical protein CMO16_07500 [Thaumarchaeota archaeon]|nr:hypothetical protein [Nitrososphaerota archaeon]
MANVKISTRDRRRDILLSQSSKTSGGRLGSKKLNSNTGKPLKKYTTENLSYPADVDSDQMQGHYIMFFINVVLNAKLKGTLKGPKNVSTVRRGELDIQARRTLSAIRPATKRLSSSISLYMPPSVQVSYGAGYTDHDIEVGAEAIIQGGIAAGGEGGAMSKVSAGVQAMSGALAGQGIKKMLTSALSAKKWTIPGMGGLDAMLQIGSGVAKSGRLEMLFDRMSRRTFSYTFTFVPKSQEESLIVQRIIFLFKSSMHPEYGDLAKLGKEAVERLTGGAKKVAANAGMARPGSEAKVGASSGRNLLIPDTFDIKYYYASTANNYMNKISTCYLESLNVTYGGDKFRAYDVQPGIFGDGAPPQNITLALGFKEMEILTREAIHEGF